MWNTDNRQRTYANKPNFCALKVIYDHVELKKILRVRQREGRVIGDEERKGMGEPGEGWSFGQGVGVFKSQGEIDAPDANLTVKIMVGSILYTADEDNKLILPATANPCYINIIDLYFPTVQLYSAASTRLLQHQLKQQTIMTVN